MHFIITSSKDRFGVSPVNSNPPVSLFATPFNRSAFLLIEIRAFLIVQNGRELLVAEINVPYLLTF